MKRVDAHAHVFLPASDDYPRGVDELVPADREAPVERLRTAMEGAGVDAAVLVPLDHHDRYVAEVVAAEPGRFAAVAVWNGEPVASLRERREEFPFQALRATRLGDDFLPVARWLADHGMPLWSYLPPDQLPLLERLVANVPDLTVVLNHLGFCPHDMRVDEHRRPWFADPFPTSTVDAIERLSAAPGVHVMFSGQYALSRAEPPYADLDDVVGRIVSWYGADRMLWASDFPWTETVPGYDALAELPAARFSGDELASVRGGTVLRLFPHLGGR